MCQTCSDGTFSEVSSAHHNCTEHKSCSGAGLGLALRGSSWHDNVCANYRDLKGEMSGLKRQKEANEFIQSEKKRKGRKSENDDDFTGVYVSSQRVITDLKQLCSNSFFLPPGTVPVNTINSFIFISQGVEITYKSKNI